MQKKQLTKLNVHDKNSYRVHTEETYLNIKVIDDKSIANDEKLKAFPLR